MELNLRTDQGGSALEQPPKSLLCRRYRRPYPQIADFTLKIARQQLRVLAICFQPLSDRLPIVRQTMVDGVNQDAALMLNSLSLSTAPRRI